MQLLVIYTKNCTPRPKTFPKNPEYPDEYPEYPDSQVRSFQAYTRRFPRSVPNPEYPGLYPEFRPEFSKTRSIRAYTRSLRTRQHFRPKN